MHRKLLPWERPTTRFGAHMTLQRRFAGLASLCAVVALVAGCHGTSIPQAAGFQADCTYLYPALGDGLPQFDYGSHAVAVSYEAPTWTDPGESVPIKNVTITGLYMPDLFAGNWVYASLKIGTTFVALGAKAPSDGVAPTNFGSTSYIASAGDTPDNVVVTDVYGNVSADNKFVVVGKQAYCRPAAPGATVGTITKHVPTVTTSTTSLY